MKPLEAVIGRITLGLQGIKTRNTDPYFGPAVASEYAQLVANPVAWAEALQHEEDKLDAAIVRELWRLFQAWGHDDVNPKITRAVAVVRSLLGICPGGEA